MRPVFELARKNHQDPRPTELISSDGGFNETGLEDFMNSVNLHGRGFSYAVVAIMGPQSSGKSTLLNHLFHTNFKMMNASDGRNQTTKGVWVAKALDMEPFTVVVDLEGTDGRQRGDEDDKAFEKQSALFALAVADIVLINMWCHDIGRDHAANRPLLKTIFEVMMRLFSPRKTVLFFVIRDKTKTPFETLKSQLRNDVERIWETVPKPQASENAPLDEFFKVEVTALSSYEETPKQFGKQVTNLKQQISRLISPGELAGDRQGVVPASGFSLSVKKIWETIKENKDLHLPAVKTMVATTRCEEIVEEKLRHFASNEKWSSLKEATEARRVSDFGATISSILRTYLSEYDSETMYFEEEVRSKKRQYLESEVLQLVQPAYINTLGHLRSNAFQSFETRLETLLIKEEGFAASVLTCRQSCLDEFDQGCSDVAAIEQAKWDASIVRKELVRDVDTHKLLVRAEKLPQVADQHRERLSAKLTKQLRPIFHMASDKDLTWGNVRSLLQRESDAAASALSSDVVVFELDQATLDRKIHDLKQYARRLVERNFREETRDVLGHLKRRFVFALQEKDTVLRAGEESDTVLRVEEDNIGRATKEVAYRKCLTLLSTIAALRLDETSSGGDGNGDDDIESVLVSALMGAESGVQVSEDPLASSTWEKVPPGMTLITPIQCKDIWSQFIHDIESGLGQANYAKETCQQDKHKSPPFWVTVGLKVLGLARMIVLLRVSRIDVFSIVSFIEEGLVLYEEATPVLKDMQEGVKMVKIGLVEFRRRHRKFIKKLVLALKKFYNYLKAIFARKSAD